MSVEFLLCSAKDENRIKKFMDEHWGEKHELLHNDDFLNFYYKAKNSQQLQFAIACESDEILAVAGYIFANNSNENMHLWVSIWCAKKGKNGIGLELMNALPKLTGASVIACNNIRKNTMPFYNFLGYKTGRLPHYYRLSKRSAYKIAKVKSAQILPYKNGNATFKLLENETDLQSEFAFLDEVDFHVPKKDLWYIKRRYFNYPHQKHEVYGVFINGTAKALFVMRTVLVQNINVLRIVDFIGSEESFCECGNAIDALMKEKNAEYADCYCFGINESAFEQIGFSQRGESDEIIIPNYLNPPVCENTEYYFFTSNAHNFTMFKADGDQDRPRLNIE